MDVAFLSVALRIDTTSVGAILTQLKKVTSQATWLNLGQADRRCPVSALGTVQYLMCLYCRSTRSYAVGEEPLGRYSPDMTLTAAGTILATLRESSFPHSARGNTESCTGILNKLTCPEPGLILLEHGRGGRPGTGTDHVTPNT